jgi:ATP-binding cassette subfamily C protein LapB
MIGARRKVSNVIALDHSARSTHVAARLAAALARASEQPEVAAADTSIHTSAAQADAALIDAAPQPLAAPLAPLPSAARARADRISLCLGLMGHERSVGDILEQLQLQNGAQDDLTLISAALAALGIASAQVHLARASDFPALGISAGDVVVIFGINGAIATVYDPSGIDQRRDLPIADLALQSGAVLQIQTDLDQIAQRHTAQSAPRHWFWGQFPRYRKQLGEVALGSLVANLLAVAVSLFSMQVYDRVIPYQSQATLWVLALGAMLAIEIGRAHV